MGGNRKMMKMLLSAAELTMGSSLQCGLITPSCGSLTVPAISVSYRK